MRILSAVVVFLVLSISNVTAAPPINEDYYVLRSDEAKIITALTRDDDISLSEAEEKWIPFYIEEDFETLELDGPLDETCNLFHGTTIPQAQRALKPSLTVFVCVEEGNTLTVVTTGDPADAEWVALSMLKDGVPVTPFGYEIVEIGS